MSDFAPLIALMHGFTPEEVAALQIAILNFDGSYNSLRDHLKSLEPTENVWAVVNKAIKVFMGKGRPEVSRYDIDELELWTDGYKRSQSTITTPNPDEAARLAVTAFQQAMMEFASEIADDDY
ncbi:MAG: hypothetical protein AAFZ80_00955 [Cyanobacteria bacterium P01_A01_bin.105]